MRSAGSPKLASAELQNAAQRHLQELENYFHTQRRAYAERIAVQDVRPDIAQVAAKALGELETLTNLAGVGGGGG